MGIHEKVGQSLHRRGESTHARNKESSQLFVKKETLLGKHDDKSLLPHDDDHHTADCHETAWSTNARERLWHTSRLLPSYGSPGRILHLGR